jgi:hypothetical protein
VDVIITQTAAQQMTPMASSNKTSGVSFTWTNYEFGQHSGWVNVFTAGSGTLQLWENVAGRRLPKVVYSKRIPLTPGPLVVALKVALNQDPAQPSTYWSVLAATCCLSCQRHQPAAAYQGSPHQPSTMA